MVADLSTSGTYWTGGVYLNQMSVSKTTNGGGSWTRYNIGVSTGMVHALAVDPGNPGTVYAGGYESSLAAIYKTTNGGGSWSKLGASGLSGWVYDIDVHPTVSSTLYAATNGGGFKSTNGGSTWSQVIPASYDVNAVLIDPDDPQTVYFGTDDGGVLRSEDGGGSYQPMNLGLPGEIPITCLAIHTGQYLFAGTDGGSGYRWAFGTGVEDAWGAEIGSLNLFAAPNPALGSATICYELPASGSIELSVYDVQGRLVAVLEQGTMSAGEHQVVWDPEGNTPGVYFFRLQAGSNVETGRLVLLN